MFRVEILLNLELNVTGTSVCVLYWVARRRRCARSCIAPHACDLKQMKDTENPAVCVPFTKDIFLRTTETHLQLVTCLEYENSYSSGTYLGLRHHKPEFKIGHSTTGRGDPRGSG
jgi:hypothetical protein